MAQRFLSSLNLNNLAADPSTASAGDVYYNTASSLIKYYNGSAWATLQTGAVGAGLSANTFTSTQTITPGTSVTGLIINGAASSIGAIIKANGTTPGDLQQWQDSVGTVLTKVSATGNITAPIVNANGGDGSNSSFQSSGYNQRGGTGYHGFLQATNTFGSATNPNKFFRLNSTGALEIVNSGYSATILSLTDAGSLSVPSIASPSLTGTPVSTTAAVDTNTTQIATTAFVVGQASATNPTALGSVAVGTSLRYARQDHVHPTTGLVTTVNGSSGAISNVALTTGTLGQFAATTSSQLAGVISDETGSGALVFAVSPSLTTPSIGVATGTSFNSITGLSSTNPAALGTVAVGTGTTTARADHVHPTTGLALISGATFTGSVSAPLLKVGDAPYFQYETRIGGGLDLGFKKIATLTLPTGLYTGISFYIEVIEVGGNFGNTAASTKSVYFVSAVRSGGVQDDSLSMTLTGPSTNRYLQGVKVDSATYEIQAKSPSNYNHVLIRGYGVSGLNSTVVWESGTNAGSAGIATYTPTSGSNQWFGNIKFWGTLSKDGGTSAQFLKADGSVDSSTYLTTGTASSTYLPLTGGTISSDLTISGSLTVNGTTTNLNSTNLVIEDKNIIIADVASPTNTTADGAGITIKGATDKTFTWVNATGYLTSNVGLEATSFVRTSGTSSQFLKGDGSVDTSTYLTTGTASSTYAPLASPSLTGTPLSTTAAVDTNTTQIATTAYVVGQGYLKSATASTTYAPLASPVFTGSPSWPNSRVYGFTRTVPTTVDNIVELGSSTLSNGGGTFEISIVVPSSGFSVAKQYLVPVNYDETANTWRIVNPIADGGPFSNDFTLEVNVFQSLASFRIRRSLGTTAGTAYVSIKINGNAPTFTESSATSAVTAPTTYYNGAVITQKDGAATVNGNLTATQFIRSGGTSAQFLKADGSVDSSTYLTSASGVTTVNGSSGAITNVAITNAANTFTTIQTITPATSVTGLVINGAASSIGLIVKANATTPANIQEWQSSAGSVLMSVSPTVLTSSLGSNIFTGDARVGTVTYFNSALSVGARVATEIGTVVRGFTSQSADLQQWQSSGSTVLSGVTSLGYIYSGPSYVGGQVSIQTANAGNRALVVRGSASQSSDLTQWQDSTGAILANVSAAGAITASSIIKTGGTSAQYLMADGSTTTGGALPDIIPLDDLSGSFNGVDSRFVPRYQGVQQSITNALRLLLSINGIIQYVDFPDYVWQSPLPREGFQIDNDGYIAFSEVVPAGSSFDARIMPGPSTAVNKRQYPFKPVDILLGG